MSDGHPPLRDRTTAYASQFKRLLEWIRLGEASSKTGEEP